MDHISLINPQILAINPLTLPSPIAGADHFSGDFEMIAFQSIGYTSLRDLTPACSPSEASPTGSWREIPMKDPLLQHAAWAYLQPVETERGEDDRWWRRLLEKLCGVFVCFDGVVFMVF